MIIMSVLSTMNVQVQVSATGVAGPVNPTGDVVELAFMPVTPSGTSTNPGSGDWHTGSWFQPAATVFFAQCLVGPDNGGVALPVADYNIWVKVIDNPEVPTEPVGILRIE